MPAYGTWSEHLGAAIRAAGLPARLLAEGECRDASRERCPLCHAAVLSYADEVRIKASAFPGFWERLAPGSPADPLVPSPAGRHYRTVTKRKAFIRGRRLTIGLIDPRHSSPFSPLLCAIEPPGHAAIYAHLGDLLQAAWAEPVARVLQYAVLRGGDREPAVILNVRSLEPHLSRAATMLSKALTRRFPGIRSVFLFDGGTDDRHYLGGADPILPRRFRKLFGDPMLSHRVGGKKFLFSPFSFSQVNHSILPLFLETAERLLEPRPERQLFDLYCGYGLFSLSLAPRYGRVSGVEISPAAVRSAMENARLRNARNVRFTRSSVDAGTIGRLLGTLSREDAVLLDPPRGGTERGVIGAIAERRPERVLHIFCNPGIVASELAGWAAAGYRVRGVVPFDMFPGTDNVEIMVLLA